MPTRSTRRLLTYLPHGISAHLSCLRGDVTTSSRFGHGFKSVRCALTHISIDVPSTRIQQNGHINVVTPTAPHNMTYIWYHTIFLSHKRKTSREKMCVPIFFLVLYLFLEVDIFKLNVTIRSDCVCYKWCLLVNQFSPWCKLLYVFYM